MIALLYAIAIGGPMLAVSAAAHMLYAQRQRHLVITRQVARDLGAQLDGIKIELQTLRHELNAERNQNLKGLTGLGQLT